MSQISISGRNLVVVTFLATVGIILLKAVLRVVPAPAIIKNQVNQV